MRTDNKHSTSARGLVLSAAFAVSALAAYPTLAAPTLVTIVPTAIPGVTGLGTFQADNYNLADFATVTINNATGAFTETGTLQLLTFLNGSTTLASSVTGLRNGTGASSYGLYMTFSGSGTVGTGPGGTGPFTPGGTNTGQFTSLSYTLRADAGNTDTVSASGVLTDNGTADVTLATGGLGGGVNQVSVLGAPGTPSADVLLSLVKNALGSGYFSTPLNLGFQEDAFTNTTSVVTVTSGVGTTTIGINGGGGNGTFLAPEPTSLAIFGLGIAALGMISGRRKARSIG